MDSPFIYDQYVTGKNFVGRKTESVTIRNLMERHENICIYEPPKSGKMSLVQQTLFNMRLAGVHFISAGMTFFNIRTLHSLLTKFGSAIIRPLATTPTEYAEIVASCLPGTHFTFDPERFSSDDEVVSLTWDADDNDILQMMRLPYTVAKMRQEPVYVIIEEFQNLMMMEERDCDRVFDALKAVMSEGAGQGASFIMTGSKVNAMKYIFEEKKVFYRLVEHVPLHETDGREIVEYVVRGFLVSGKVVERELLLGATNLFRCNMWYINHFTSICDSMSKGYINEGIFLEALKTLISIHEPRFMAMADDLTDHQMNMMRAILDGVKRFSASDVIEKYSFNSSANVRRIKDALKKKEIITFDDKDEPLILDPLFEYWLTTRYFER